MRRANGDAAPPTKAGRWKLGRVGRGTLLLVGVRVVALLLSVASERAEANSAGGRWFLLARALGKASMAAKWASFAAALGLFLTVFPSLLRSRFVMTVAALLLVVYQVNPWSTLVTS